MSFLDQLNKGLENLESQIKETKLKISLVDFDLRKHGNAVIDLEDQKEQLDKDLANLIKEKKELEKHASEYTTN